eukprot:jgi/Chlat1/3210/Chrsp22S03494
MVTQKQPQQPKQPSSAAAADANPTAHNNHLNIKSHLSNKHLNTTTNKASSSDKLNNIINSVSHVRLYVGGLPSAGVTPDQLAERFRPFGTVSDVEIDCKDRRFAHLTLLPKAADRIATSKPTFVERLQAEWQADAAAQAMADDNRDNGTNLLPHALANPSSTLHIRPHPLAKETIEVPVSGSAKKHRRNFPELTFSYKPNTTSLWDLLHTPSSTTPTKPKVQPSKPKSQPNNTNNTPNTALRASNTPVTQARPRLSLNDIPHATRTPLHDVDVGDDDERVVDDMEEEPPTPPRRDERFLLRNLKRKTDQAESAVGAMNDDIDPTEREALDGERDRQLELLSAMFPSQNPASEKPAVNLQPRVKKNLPAFSSTSRFDPTHSDDADEAVDNGEQVSSEIAVKPVVSSVAASRAFMKERDPSLLLRNLKRLKAGTEAVGDSAANAAGNAELRRGVDADNDDTSIGDASAGVGKLLESGKQLPAAARKEGTWASLTAGGHNGSAAEVEAEWRAKRATLLEDFKRKRRAAAKDGTAAAAAAKRPARGAKTAR